MKREEEQGLLTPKPQPHEREGLLLCATRRAAAAGRERHGDVNALAQKGEQGREGWRRGEEEKPQGQAEEKKRKRKSAHERRDCWARDPGGHDRAALPATEVGTAAPAQTAGVRLNLYFSSHFRYGQVPPKCYDQ